MGGQIDKQTKREQELQKQVVNVKHQQLSKPEKQNPDTKQKTNFWLIISGLLITLAFMLLMQLLKGTPLKITNPGVLIIIGVVISAFLGGWKPAAFSGIIGFIYVLFYFSLSGQLFTYTFNDLKRLIVLIIAIPAITIFVSVLKRSEQLILGKLKLEIARDQESKELSNALNQIGSAVATLNIEEIMQTVVTQGAEALACDAAGILLSEDNQWKLSYLHGLPSALVGTRLSGKEMSHLMEAVKTRQPVVIPDVRFFDVNDKLIKKFKLGAVIAISLIVEGKPAGIIGFNYSHPTQFSESQIDFVHKLSTNVSLAMENARLYEVEHRIAETLQEAILAIPAKVPGIDFGFLYKSATEEARVGGDFYDIFELEHGNVGIVAGDVSGKGLEAATLATLVKNAIKAYAHQGGSPAKIMDDTNKVVAKSTTAGSFITVIFGILNTKTGDFTYCNAGHPHPIIKTHKKTGFLNTGSPVIGIETKQEFIEAKAELQKDDYLILYTDGITEARRGKDFFGEERLLKLVKDLKPQPPRKFTQSLFDEVNKFASGQLSDDIVLLTIRLK